MAVALGAIYEYLIYVCMYVHTLPVSMSFGFWSLEFLDLLCLFCVRVSTRRIKITTTTRRETTTR
jgi:hypothetical protein